MKINVSEYGGFCPGVKRADKEIRRLLNTKRNNEKIYIIGSLIHNDIYNQELISLGANIINFEEINKILHIKAVLHTFVISTHGIKKENFDWVLEKATELGVTDIYPLLTDRTVVSKLNLERAQTIVREASEQCERLNIPTIHTPLKLKDLFKTLPQDIQPVCLSERGITSSPLNEKEHYAFCVGPEGGWTPEELSLFEKNKALFWHLGTTILRAETASISALACCQFAFK